MRLNNYKYIYKRVHNENATIPNMGIVAFVAKYSYLKDSVILINSACVRLDAETV